MERKHCGRVWQCRWLALSRVLLNKEKPNSVKMKRNEAMSNVSHSSVLPVVTKPRER